MYADASALKIAVFDRWLGPGPYTLSAPHNEQYRPQLLFSSRWSWTNSPFNRGSECVLAGTRWSFFSHSAYYRQHSNFAERANDRLIFPGENTRACSMLDFQNRRRAGFRIVFERPTRTSCIRLIIKIKRRPWSGLVRPLQDDLPSASTTAMESGATQPDLLFSATAPHCVQRLKEDVLVA